MLFLNQMVSHEDILSTFCGELQTTDVLIVRKIMHSVHHICSFPLQFPYEVSILGYS